MLRHNRVLWKSGVSTLNDLSKKLSDPLSGAEVIPFLTATDAIFIGSDLPFNHRWFEVSVANNVVASPSVAVWDGSTWIPCVDVIDETVASGGKTLSQSGLISWVPDRLDSSWSRIDFTEELPDSEILSTVKIYDLYWVKMTFNANLRASTSLGYIGHKFSSDSDLFAEYPDLNNTDLMTAFASGGTKTDWKDQEFLAAEYIIQDLRNLQVIWSKNQILDPQLFKSASVHKTAEIIYRSFGDDYKDDKESSAQAYKQCMSKKSFNVDLNLNATLDEKETQPTTNWMTR